MQPPQKVEAKTEDEARLAPKPKAKVKNWMRNKPCPCKSAKKFKHCCMAKFK